MMLAAPIAFIIAMKSESLRQLSPPLLAIFNSAASSRRLPSHAAADDIRRY
jgi:hypothetical protein